MKTKLLKAALCLFLTGASSLVQAQVLDKSPLVHLSFDKLSTNGTTTNVLNDGTGGALMNGVMNSSASGGVTIVPGGRFGNALQVTGTGSADASVRIANAVVPLTVAPGSAWTVACWIQSTTKGGTWMYQGSGGWAQDNTTFAMVVNNGATNVNGDAAGGVRNSRGWQQGTTPVDDGNWHHIVFTFDGTTKVQYIDGVVDAWVANQWNNTPAATGNQFWIGGGGTGQSDGQVCLNGLIDEAYVFNRALSQSDVLALYNSNNVPHVPVAVTVNPTSGYRGIGTTFTITATTAPAAGFSVTNISVNLSSLALSATAPLVLSAPNVYTNTFTLPSGATIGTTNLVVTAIDTEPLVGSGSAAFTVVARPPTNLLASVQLTGPTNPYAYTEVTYRFVATNNSPDFGAYTNNYSWYKNGTLVTTNNMGPFYTFLCTPADNNATIQCIANITDTNYSSLSVTSGVITMAPQTGALVYTNGLKREFFLGASRANVEIGNVPKGNPISLTPTADFTGGQGDNYTERYSGYFIPPTNGNYVIFLAADDDTDLFLSTDSNPNNKRIVCQETGWSGTDNWLTSGGGGSFLAQKRSDQWTNSVGATPYSAGIPLIGGQLYYLESVHHQGTGGDNWAVTYSTVEDLAANGFASGTAGLLVGTNNNIATITWPGTNIVWTQQIANKSVFEGDTAVFTAVASSDAEMVPNYTWYVNGVIVQGPTPNGTNLALPLVTLGQSGAQISVVASTESLSITNGPVTMTVLQAVFEPGYAKEERWQGLTSKTPIENGTAGTPTFSVAMPGFEQSADGDGTGQGDFGLRTTGFFIPPADGNYVLYVSSDDDSDLFLSTDDTAAHKRLIAQEAGWSGTFNWINAGGGGSSASQKRSDQWVPTAGANPPNGSGIPLLGGHKYFMEVDHHNGAAGGTHMGVTYEVYATSDPAVGEAPKMIGNLIGINAVRSTVAFAAQPANTNSVRGGYAHFSALGTTDSLLPVSSSLVGLESRFTNNYVLYQWYKNGVKITNATAPTLTVGPLEPSDDGAVITCQIRSLGFADASFNPIWSNSLPATITLSGQSVFEPGYIRHDVWTNQISRLALEGGTQDRDPYVSYATAQMEGPIGSSNPANYIQRIFGYFTPPADGNYAFVVNTDDDSDLFLSTDTNRVNMRLVAQETVWSNPFQWNTAGSGSTSQKNSSTWSPDGGNTVPGQSGFPMVHGQKYYLELDHHNGSGNNNAELTYYNFNTEVVPANGNDTRLTNSTIGMYFPRVASMAFTQQPVSQSATSGGNSVTFSAFGTSSSTPVIIGTTGDFRVIATNPPTSVLFQWYKDGVPIPGATSSNYTRIPILPSDNNASFVCGIRVLGYSDNTLTPTYSNSTPAILTVTTETVPPLLTYAAMLVNSNQDPVQIIVDVTFNEWMDTTTANTAGNYTVAGASVIKATLESNHRTVELLLNQVPTLPLSVTVSGVKDVSGNSIAANSTAPVVPPPVQLTFQDIGNVGNASTFGTTGIDPAYPSSASITASNGFIVSAEGSDIFGTADGFNFGWELKTNDFDVAVRVVRNGHSSNFAKAGLMVRDTLAAASRNWSVINDPAAADGIQAPDNSGFGANNVEANMRATNNAGVGTISWKTNSSTTIPAYPNAWVRIKRTGSILTSFSSTDGINWLTLGTYTATNATAGPLPDTLYVGIATTAHNNDSATAVPPPPPFRFYNTAEYANYNSSFVATVLPVMTSSRSGANLVISWTPNVGHLETSPALSGPSAIWTTLGTVNPATIPMTADKQFFRVVVP
jgi:concanavalin A-like lectin/glucanase superfamily protein/PA14 domain-containing protein